MNIKIRDLTEHDLLYVLEIANQSFSTPWSLKSFKNELLNPSSILKVVEFKDEIVGYIIVKKILDEAELLSIAVKPEFRRRGIATKLIKSVLNDLRDSVTTLFLEVRTSNIEAISLYEKIGFRKVGLRKRYYILPEEDAIIMKLDLS